MIEDTAAKKVDHDHIMMSVPLVVSVVVTVVVAIVVVIIVVIVYLPHGPMFLWFVVRPCGRSSVLAAQLPPRNP